MPTLGNQASIDRFNEQLRSNPQYQAFLRSLGVNPAGPVQLSGQQRAQAEAWVRRTFGDIGNLQIDPAGNLNQDEGFSRHAKWIVPAAIGAGTLGLGLAGVGPAAGLFGSGASGGAAGLPALGNVNAITEGLAASHAAEAAAAAGGLGSLNPVIDRLSKGSAEDVARGGARSLLDNLLSPEGLTTAGTIAASLASRGDGTNAQTRATEEQARRLQAITEARMRRVDPLHEAVTQLAFGRLPVSSRQGIGLPRVPLPGA